MHSFIMPIGRNINENGGKKTHNKKKLLLAIDWKEKKS